MDFPIKSTTLQLPDGIASSVLEKKEEPSSSSAMPDLFVPEQNEVKLSGSSKLTNSRNCVDKETVNGADTGSDCVEDALMNISTKNEAISIVQQPSPVKSVDFIPVQSEVPSSAVDAVGNGESVHLEGTDSRGSREGIGFSHVRSETSLFSSKFHTLLVVIILSPSMLIKCAFYKLISFSSRDCSYMSFAVHFCCCFKDVIA